MILLDCRYEAIEDADLSFQCILGPGRRCRRCQRFFLTTKFSHILPTDEYGVPFISLQPNRLPRKDLTYPWRFLNYDSFADMT